MDNPVAVRFKKTMKDNKIMREALELINKEAVFFSLDNHNDEARIKTLDIIGERARYALLNVPVTNEKGE